MVNNKKLSITPGSTGVSSSAASTGASSSASGSTTGGSNTSGSSAGGGTASSAAPPVSMPATTKPGSGFRKELTAMANGFGTAFPAGSNLTVNGQSESQSSIGAALQAVLVLFGNVDAAVRAAKLTRLVLQAALPGAHQFVDLLKAALVANFGKGNPALVAFGISTAKPRQLTSEQKAAQKARAKATRGLRGTGGKRQKAAVKFTGTVAVQTTLSDTQAGGGSATSPTGSSSAGAITPAASGNASGSGSTSSSGS